MSYDLDPAAAPLAANLQAARGVQEQLPALAGLLGQAAQTIAGALLNGDKVLCCGNGGSAADCAHFCTEIAGRYRLERRGFPAIDLTANHSLLTALVNDFPPEQVFARQVQALGKSGDVLIAFSTSGNSANVRRAIEAAGSQGLRTIAFLGRGGGGCKGLAGIELIVPSDNTQRIQEAHQLLYHTICDLLDPLLGGRR